MESYSPGTADGTESDEEDSAMNDNSEGSDCLESIPVVCKLEPPDDEPPEEPECLETIPVVCKLETAEDDDVTTEDVDLMESMPVVCKLDDPEEGGSGTCLDEEALQDSSVQGDGGDLTEEEDEMLEDRLQRRVGSGLELKDEGESDSGSSESLRCSMCNFSTSVKPALRNHIKIVHNDYVPFQCELCSYVGDNHTRFGEHLKRHKTLKPFKCQLCDYSATVKQSLRVHINFRHRRKGPVCGACRKVCRNKASLLKHMRGVHSEKEYACHLCDYKAAQLDSVKGHTETEHGGDKPLWCTYCGYRTYLKRSLKEHISKKHLSRFDCALRTRDSLEKCAARPLKKCPSCDLTYSSGYNLKRHYITVHGNIRPYPCDFCQYRAAQKSSLNKHLRAVHWRQEKSNFELTNPFSSSEIQAWSNS